LESCATDLLKESLHVRLPLIYPVLLSTQQVLVAHVPLVGFSAAITEVEDHADVLHSREHGTQLSEMIDGILVRSDLARSLQDELEDFGAIVSGHTVRELFGFEGLDMREGRLAEVEVQDILRRKCLQELLMDVRAASKKTNRLRLALAAAGVVLDAKSVGRGLFRTPRLGDASTRRRGITPLEVDAHF
jgi:hypothetical protein